MSLHACHVFPLQGYFLLDDSCVECEGDYAGADCDEKGATLGGLRLFPGYWRTSSSSDSLLECGIEGACVGGNDTRSYCAEAYQSYKCDVCSSGYYSFGDSCYSCSDDASIAIWAFLSLFLLAFIAIGLSVLVWRLKSNMKDSDNNDETQFSARTASMIKILLAFCIIVYGMEGVFAFDWPVGFQSLINNVISWLSLNLMSFVSGIECVVGAYSFYDTLLFETLGPLVVTFFLVVAVVVDWFRLQHRIQHGGNLRELTKAHTKLSDVCFNAFLWVAYIVLCSVSTTLFDLFVCETFDDNTQRLQSSLDISCQDDRYRAYAIYGGLMICVCKFSSSPLLLETGSLP